MRRIITIAILSLVAALLLTNCGGTPVDPTPTQPAMPTTMQDAATAEPVADKAQDMGDGMVENLENKQAAEGGGHATFTAGDKAWKFDSVLCAFGEAEIGQKGAEFVLSSIQDGLQLYLSIDSQGHSMSLEDVKDFKNPSISLAQADSFVDFLILKGKNVSGEAEVLDWNEEPPTKIPATVEAMCP